MRVRLSDQALDHEQVVVRRGPRSGLTVIVAVHSTARGPALGGCRMWRYPTCSDGLRDALRLSAGMTDKAALAGLRFGGGKAVVALPPTTVLEPAVRREALLDVGDTVESLSGCYVTGPDAGTGTADMAVVAERTEHVLCTPGGSGDSSPATAAAAVACLEVTARHRFGPGGLTGRSVTVIGLGHVGRLLAGDLAAAGVRLTVTDLDPAARAVADQLGATWVAPDRALRIPTDVLVPAAVGVAIDAATADELSCAAVVGPANDQLTDDTVADLLHRRGVLWAPDYLVGAGGVVHATAVERDDADPGEAARRVHALADVWRDVLDRATHERIGPHHIARRLARERLGPSPRACSAP